MASQARQLADKSIAPPGRRNLIINGAMVIDQRNNGSAVTGSSAEQRYAADRFILYANTTATITAQQVSDAPDGFEKSDKLTCTTAASSDVSGSRLQFVQGIEGYNTAHLQFGSSNAKTITLSFWVKASNAGTYGGSFTNGAANRAYPYQYTINSANTWEYKTVTIAGDTSGTWATDNTSGMYVFWGLGVGSNFEGTANQWNGAFDIAPPSSFSLKDNLNATWQITGVQLEVGSTATEFEHRNFGEELTLCQRYFWKTYEYETAVGSVTNDSALGRFIDDTQNYASIQIPYNPMRTQPTATIYNPNDGTTGEVRTDSADKAALITRLGSNGNGFIYVNNSSVGKSVGTHAHLTLEAEL